MSNPITGQHPPVVAIYQNPDHVAGLLQQLMNQPLVTAETRQNDHGNSDATSHTGRIAAQTSAKGSMPGIVGAAAGGEGNLSRDHATTITTNSRSSQSFVYSQAYYLNIVRAALRDQNFVTYVDASSDMSSLIPGNFIEYTATFSPSTIPALMDVLTPDLIAAIVEWLARRRGTADIDFTVFKEIKSRALELDLKATSNASLARQITEAVKLDFRQEKTREFYGSIPTIPDLTMLTICDASHFVVEDEDRILDGSYTVLGKVTSSLQADLPVFQRNKLMRNVSPDAVDKMVDFMKEKLNNTRGGKIGETDIDELLAMDLSSRVPGSALRVIPVAIFI
ncbi:DUF6414 family protein [Clavibacter tessellarius]|uniref:DUF6414 family protein n=1 Tax=Clavibacter tessellarius TaxID=31965 RepID=UPI000B0881A7|nr:hypothetical protein [Clavibacter michiganensis]